jgi:hypothetical protein
LFLNFQIKEVLVRVDVRFFRRSTIELLPHGEDRIRTDNLRHH